MNYLIKFRKVRCFMFDIDGVMTDGQVLINEHGELLRRMNVRDGFAIRVAVQCGYKVAVISGGTTPGAKCRLGDLGVNDIYLGIQDKVATYRELIQKYGLKTDEILYMGDDLPDLKVMSEVGMPCCPKDAVDEIRDLSAYISPLQGGHGCVRDVIEKVLKLQGQWPGYPNIKAPHIDN